MLDHDVTAARACLMGAERLGCAWAEVLPEPSDASGSVPSGNGG
jgi:hypothetical protein